MSHLQLVQVCFTRISWPNATVIIGQVTHKLTCMVSTRHGLQHPIIRGKVGWTMTWSSSVKPTLVFESWWRPSTIQRLSTKSLEQDLFRNIVKKIINYVTIRLFVQPPSQPRMPWNEILQECHGYTCMVQGHPASRWAWQEGSVV